MRRSFLAALMLLSLTVLCPLSSLAADSEFLGNETEQINYEAAMAILQKEVNSILGKMELKQDEARKNKKEEKRITEADALLKKDEREAPTIENVQRETKVWENEKDQFNKYWQETINLGCPKEGGESTNIPLVNMCNQRVTKINPWRQNLESRRNVLEGRWNIVNDLINRRMAITHDTMANFEEKKRINGEFEDLQITLREVYVKMEGLCRQLLRDPKAKMEELKHKCGNVQFDNANPNLPSLEDVGIKPGTKFFGR